VKFEYFGTPKSLYIFKEENSFFALKTIIKPNSINRKLSKFNPLLYFSFYEGKRVFLCKKKNL